MFLPSTLDMADWTMAITGDPILDFFFSLMVVFGIMAGGLGAILSFFK